MSLILSWVLFPLVLVAVGCGWGVLVQRAAGTRLKPALLVPVGWAAVIVVAGLLTAFTVTARAAIPVVTAGAAIGLLIGGRGIRIERWALVCGVGTLLAYGAPVLLSGQATFAGYIKLDDTATWLDVIDHVFTHSLSIGGLPSSTATVALVGDVGSSYPLGAFMLVGVGHALTGIDAAWIYQPYLACCAAAVALCIYALTEPLVASAPRRALLAFLAAQSALLYGYSLWGGIKELTAAFLLVLGLTLAAGLTPRPPRRARELLPVAVSAGALITTLSVGAGAWAVPALLMLGAIWARSPGGIRRPRALMRTGVVVTVLTAACVGPVAIVASAFLRNDHFLFSAGQTQAVQIGNLAQPLSAFQLAGIWPVGDFRLRATTTIDSLLIVLVLLAAAGAIWFSLRRRQYGMAMYVGVALCGCGVFYVIGSTPWIEAKVLAIGSPALLAAALTGAVMLWTRYRAGAIVVVALAFGVLWSNYLQYHDVVLAPRDRLAELAHVNGLLAGKGPTFIDDYELYADRHFDLSGEPVEPADYRDVALPLYHGVLLTKASYADIDSFPLSTLMPYRSLIVRDSPVESRPPSIYQLVWKGRYYELWQRPAEPDVRILAHLDYGDSIVLPYCGNSQNAPALPLCSVQPTGMPACSQILAAGRTARREHAWLEAYQRPAPIVLRGDQTLWPSPWIHDTPAHTLVPDVPGVATAHVALDSTQEYELWLGGSFTRGFRVSLDGRSLGSVRNEPWRVPGYVPVAQVLMGAGLHTLALTYPHGSLSPGSGDNTLTSLTTIVFEPLQSPAPKLLRVSPGAAASLCGRPLDWLEIVAPV